jgi:hypothetical protein
VQRLCRIIGLPYPATRCSGVLSAEALAVGLPEPRGRGASIGHEPELPTRDHPTTRQPDAGRTCNVRATRAVSGPRSRS